MKAPIDQAQAIFRDETARENVTEASTGATSDRCLTLHLVLFFSARLILGGVFILASVDKIVHPLGFAKSISNYQVLPDHLINLAALILPWLELMLGTFLVFGVWLPGTIVLTDLLLVVFSTALLFNLARGLNVDCGCFSTSPTDNPAAAWYLMRDALLLLLGGYLGYRSLIKPSPPPGKESGSGNRPPLEKVRCHAESC